MNSDGKNNQKGSAFGDDKDNKLSKKGGKVNFIQIQK
jgi:hypothetical protein